MKTETKQVKNLQPNLNPNEILKSQIKSFFVDGLKKCFFTTSGSADIVKHPESFEKDCFNLVEISSDGVSTGLFVLNFVTAHGKVIPLLNMVRLGEIAIAVGFGIGLLQSLQIEDNSLE